MTYVDYKQRCEARRKQLAALLALHAGRVRAVAAAAGLDRKYTYRVLRQYGLIPSRPRGNAEWRALQ